MISTNIVASLILERSSKHDHSLQYIFHVSTPIYQHYFHPQQNPYYAYRNPQEMDRVKKNKLDQRRNQDVHYKITLNQTRYQQCTTLLLV